MINNVTLIGRLTATPELRQTTTGKTVVSFCIAVERRFDRATSDFINIVAWNKTAEFVSKYFAKGDLIALTGSIQTRKYEDKDGNKRTAFEVLADDVSFCGKKEKSSEPDFEEINRHLPLFPQIQARRISLSSCCKS